PDEGKLIHVLLRAIAARTALELGALGGYSGVWIARALPADGRLVTIEKDPRHAALARQAYGEAGLGRQVQLIEGACLDVLPTLAPGFDAVFVDADKEPLAQYFEWSVRLLRPGGLLLCDNAFFHGAVVDASDRSAQAGGGKERSSRDSVRRRSRSRWPDGTRRRAACASSIASVRRNSWRPGTCNHPSTSSSPLTSSSMSTIWDARSRGSQRRSGPAVDWAS